MKRILAVMAGLVLVLAGCEEIATEASSPLDLILVRTEQIHHTRAAVDVPAPVNFLVENHTARAVLLHRCGEEVMAAVDRKGAQGWQQYAGDICPTHLSMVPLSLGSGGSVRGVQHLHEPGIYRLRLGVDRGNAQVTWTVTSNEFVVE